MPPGPDKRDIEFRAGFGLRADIAYIDSVKRSPTANYTWGVALTPEEAGEINFRDGVLGPLLNSAQVRAFERDNAATFAGDYLDQAGGGILTFLFTRNDPLYREKLNAMIPYPSRVAVRVVQYTKAELETTQSRVAKAAQGDSAIYVIAIDVPRNVVEVSVGGCDDSSLAPLQGLPPGELLVYPGTRPSTSTGPHDVAGAERWFNVAASWADRLHPARAGFGRRAG